MADPTVKIILSAIDNASGVLSGVSGATRGVFGSFTELSSALGLARQAFGAVQGALDATAGATMNYGLQVRDFARTLGVSTEEASKLIQVADDLRVDMGTLRFAFRMALQEGISPGIEGLKQMAAEFQAFPDPVKRAQYAMEKFGTRSGIEMMKILEQTPAALDAMAASAEQAGLVMGEQAVQAAEAYYAATDNLDDALTGLKYTIGNELLPVLTRAAEITLDLATATAENVTELDEYAITIMRGALLSGRLSAVEAERVRVLLRIYDATQQARTATSQATDSLRLYADLMATRATPAAQEFTTALLTEAEFSRRAAAAQLELARQTAYVDEATRNAQPAVKKFLDGLDREIASPISNFIKDLTWYVATGGKFEQAFLEIKTQVTAAGGLSAQEGIDLATALLVEAERAKVEAYLETKVTALMNLQGIGLTDAKALELFNLATGDPATVMALLKELTMDFNVQAAGDYDMLRYLDRDTYRIEAVVHWTQTGYKLPPLPGPFPLPAGEDEDEDNYPIPPHLTAPGGGRRYPTPSYPTAPGGGGGGNIYLNVYGAPGQSERALADYVIQELDRRTRAARYSGARFVGAR